jgi:hypothetical protein
VRIRWLAMVLGLAVAACVPPTLTVTPPRKIVPLGPFGGDGREIVLVLPFRDERPSKVLCGIQKNAYNAETGYVACSVEPSVFIGELLSHELQSAGFHVVEKPSGPRSVRVEGTLRQFFVEPEVDLLPAPETDVHVKLAATSASGLSAERDFYVKAHQPADEDPNESFQRSAENATRDVVRQMAKAIVELVDRFPGLGKAGT